MGLVVILSLCIIFGLWGAWKGYKRRRENNDSWKELEIQTKKIAEDIRKLNENIFLVNNSEINFSIEKHENSYDWYAFFYYYPKSRFAERELNEEQKENRKHVYFFKDGINSEFYATQFSHAIINLFGRDRIENVLLLIVPASNSMSTSKRFELFCAKVSEYTGLINGYSILKNNKRIRTPAHQGGSRFYLPSDYLEIDGNIKNMDILIIDDLRTSGDSSVMIHQFLKDSGAGKITFLYLAKTA